MRNTVEVRFKPADVGSVADGSVTNVKVAAGAAIAKSKLAALAIDDTDLASGTEYVKGAAADTTGDKKVIAIGWDDVTSEVVVDHAV